MDLLRSTWAKVGSKEPLAGNADPTGSALACAPLGEWQTVGNSELYSQKANSHRQLTLALYMRDGETHRERIKE